MNNDYLEFLVNVVVPAAIGLLLYLSRKYFPQAAEVAAEKRTVAVAHAATNGNGNGNGNGFQSHFQDLRLLYGSMENRMNDMSHRQDAQSKDVDNLEQRFEAHSLQTQQALAGIETRLKEHITSELEDFKHDMRQRLDGQANINSANYKFQTEIRTSMRNMNDDLEAVKARLLKLEGDGGE